MKTMRMPKDRFNTLLAEKELICPNAVYVLINANELDKGELLAVRHHRSTNQTDILTVALMK